MSVDSYETFLRDISGHSGGSGWGSADGAFTDRQSWSGSGFIRKVTLGKESGIIQRAILRAVEEEESDLYESAGHPRWQSFNGLLQKAVAEQSESGQASEDAMQGLIYEATVQAHLRDAAQLMGGREGSVFTKHDLMRAIAEDGAQQGMCLKLPFVLFYSFIYILLCQLHYSTPRIYFQEQSILHGIGEPLQIDTTEDIYQWLEGTLVPYLWSDDPRMALRMDGPCQTLVAGMLIRTARGPEILPCADGVGDDPTPCTPSYPRSESLSVALKDWYFAGPRRLAVPDHRTAPPPRDTWSSRRLKQVRKAWVSRPIDPLGLDDSYTLAVPMSMHKDGVRALINGFRNSSSPLLDSSTLFLSVDFAMIHEESSFGGRTFSQVVIYFMFSRGGGIYRDVSILTMPMTYSSTSKFVLGVWLLLLVYSAGVEAFGLILAKWKHAFLVTIRNFPTIVDLLVVSGGWVLLAGIVWELSGAASFGQAWADYQDERSVADSATIEDLDRAWLRIFSTDTRSWLWIGEQVLTVVPFYTLLLVVRFLVSTMGHPRLAMVVRTLVGGMTDLLHLLFIFMLVFLAYVVSACILFGRRLEELSTFKGSFGYCLQIVFQHQFDLASIAEQDMLSAMVWLVTFVLLTILVAINMVLAMMFDKYGEVRERIDKEESLFTSLLGFVRQAQHSSRWMTHAELTMAVLHLPAATHLTPGMVRREIPQAPELQLQLLLKRARLVHRRAQTLSTRTNAATLIASLLLTLADTRRAMCRTSDADDGRHSHRSRRRVSEVQRGVEADAAAVDSQQSDRRRAKGLLQREGGGAHGPRANCEVHQADSEESAVIPQESVASARTEPAHLQAALVHSLRQQRHQMASMLQQLDEMRALMASRGLAGPCGFPTPAPPRPAELAHFGGSGPSPLRGAAAARAPKPTVHGYLIGSRTGPDNPEGGASPVGSVACPDEPEGRGDVGDSPSEPGHDSDEDAFFI